MEALWHGSKHAKTALDDAKKRGDALLRKFERSAK
jgi:sn-glycerol 3-phosphate transport system substrate-binding protein